MTEGEDRAHSASLHTHRATDDPWAELERLATAATPRKWSRHGIRYVQDANRCEIIAEVRRRGDERQMQADAAYIAAANPATVLKLIEAARASQVGMSEASAPNPPPKEAEPWRPIEDAPKDRTPVLAAIHPDLFPRICPGRPDLERWNGQVLVIHHPGLAEDGFDVGWSVSAPVGTGIGRDDWFSGWMPLPSPPDQKNVK